MFRIEIDNINGKTKSLYAYGDHSILIELEQQNVLINHSCRQGHCGSCILQLLSGNVIHQDSIIPLSQGEILACRATPVTDIKIASRD
ncbi:MAG: 2Fe-2S iron-sulfur cluster binding domain-containing protein [Candidatus Vesicomyosocius endoextente]|uniref:2Fe-2S iron-sulfur cluster binding domain-containing protein n=1 Tax=Candidatus Vesicomyosocius endoextente TaxID=2738853 RepID=A0A853G5S3_9GAMM|nr:2Fe-2S iron-sulfur cluster binding domain-containing protein [Candidatus Vesicomyosocius endoextente]